MLCVGSTVNSARVRTLTGCGNIRLFLRFFSGLPLQWVGTFDFEALEFTSEGEVFHFPRDHHCDVSDCTGSLEVGHRGLVLRCLAGFQPGTASRESVYPASVSMRVRVGCC
jgi:hypothetical protein